MCESPKSKGRILGPYKEVDCKNPKISFTTNQQKTNEILELILMKLKKISSQVDSLGGHGHYLSIKSDTNKPPEVTWKEIDEFYTS